VLLNKTAHVGLFLKPAKLESNYYSPVPRRSESN